MNFNLSHYHRVKKCQKKIKEYLNYFNISINDMLIIYDHNELDIGDYKFKTQGSSAGQKGIDSIIYHLSGLVASKYIYTSL